MNAVTAPTAASAASPQIALPAPPAPRLPRLQAAWLALAVGALGLASVAASVLVLARSPALSTPGVEAHFSAALIMHVELATLVWFLAFSVVLLNAALGARQPRHEWLAVGAAAAGVAAICLSPFLAPGPSLRSNYFPVNDSPWFIGGLTLVVASALLSLATLAGRALARWRSADATPALVGWTMLPLLPATVSMIWSYAGRPDAPPAITHEIVSWGPGHLMQFYFAAAMMLAWVRLAAALGIESRQWRGIAWPFAALVLPTLLAFPAHALYAVDTAPFRKSMTLLMAWFGWAGPLLLVWRWRDRLFRRSRLQPPTPERAMAALALHGSILLFVAGIVLGALIGGDNTMVPAHYHGTIGGVTLAFIGVACAGGLRQRAPQRATWPLCLYGCGFALMIAGLAVTGWQGAPRKTPFAAAAEHDAAFVVAMSVHGVGGLLAVIGTLLFVYRMAGTLRAGTADLTWPALCDDAGAPPQRRDVRGRTLALTTLAGLLGGLAIAVGTRHAAMKAELNEWLAQTPAIDRLSHLTDQRDREIALRFQQGVAMLHARRYDEAIAAFHRVLGLDPKLVEAHVNMGYALLGAEEFSAARDFFNGALELRPDQANAYYGLAVAAEGLGDLEQALGAMRTFAHRAAPNDPHRIKAEAAVWEWQAALAARRGATPESSQGSPRRSSPPSAMPPQNAGRR